MVKRGLLLLGIISVLLVYIKCGDVTPPNPPIPYLDGGQQETFELLTPQVTSITPTVASVGDEIRIYGNNFVDAETGWVELTFRGTFEYEDQNGNLIQEEVNVSVPVEYVSPNELKWNFGPYRIPFGPGDRLGKFEGVVFATNKSYVPDKYGYTERRQKEDTWIFIEFISNPSVIIKNFVPYGKTPEGDYWSASCRIIPERVINLLHYKLEVKTVGFEAKQFKYLLSSGIVINDQSSEDVFQDNREIVHDITGNYDVLGDLEKISFAEVPYGMMAYRTGILVTAIDHDNNPHSVFLKLTVRRPLEIRYDGNVQIAEIYDPVPVSGCIPGGVTGRQVHYSEMQSETRTRTFTVQWVHNWTTSYTESHTETYGEGGSEANRIGFSSTDETNWKWSVHGEVYGEGGVNLVAEGKAGFRLGGGHDWGGSHSFTRSGDTTWTYTYTYNEAYQASQSIIESEGESQMYSWTVSSSEAQALQIDAFIRPHKYGVFYRQTIRFIRIGKVFAYDLCGNWTEVGEMVLNDYTWSPDLAEGDECGETLPETELPPGQCIIPPCDGTYDN